MNCLYYDEDKKQCINPYCFYKGMDCPVKVYPEMCKMYDAGDSKIERLIQGLRRCAGNDCDNCSMSGKGKCYDSLMEMAADELEKLTKEKE